MPKPSKLLVVEDEVLLLLDLVDNLADFDIQAIPLTTADGAAATLLNMAIDGLVTDIDLPGRLSGLDLARQCATLRPGLPIVVVSGGRTPSVAELPPGAVFIPKPYRIEHVIAALSARVAAAA